MKTIIYYFGVALVAAFMSLQIHAEEPESPILLMNKELEGEVIHRSPEQVPIYDWTGGVGKNRLSIPSSPWGQFHYWGFTNRAELL